MKRMSRTRISFGEYGREMASYIVHVPHDMRPCRAFVYPVDDTGSDSVVKISAAMDYCGAEEVGYMPLRNSRPSHGSSAFASLNTCLMLQFASDRRFIGWVEFEERIK